MSEKTGEDQVSQSSIDTTQHKQDVSFYIDTSGLPFGLKDTAAIEIQSNGGVERIPVNLSVEAPEADLSRFRSGLTIGGLILGGLFGFFIYNLNFIQGMSVNVAGLAGIAAIIGAVFIGAKLGYKDGGGGAAFGWGCGTLVTGGIVIAILEHYPHALSTVAWSFAYGSFANMLSNSVRKALWRGNKNLPVLAGVAAVVLATAIIIGGLIITKKEREATLAREQAIEAAIKPTASKLPGKWYGKIGEKKAKFFIEKTGNQLFGKAVYEGVEEKLSVEFKSVKGNIVIILKGISYKRLSGSGSFSLDTFYGGLSTDGHSITGDYEDAAGRKGKWSASKAISPLVNIEGEWEGKWKYEGSNGALTDPRNFGKEINFVLSVKQNGSNLTGSIAYIGEEAHATVNGEIYGDQIDFEYKYSDGTVIEYTGMVNHTGDKAQGTWTQSEGTGSWEMIKKTVSKVTETSSEKSTSAPSPASTSHVNSPESTHRKEPSSFAITINSSPDGATIFVDKIKRGITPLKLSLAKGTHGIRIEKEGYKTLWDIINVDRYDKEFNFILKR